MPFRPCLPHHLLGVVLSAWVAIGSLTAAEPELSTAMRPLSGEVVTGDPAHLLSPSKLDAAELVLTNHGAEPMTGTVAVGIRQRSYHPVELQSVGPVTIAAGDSWRMATRLGEGLGIRYCDWSFTPEQSKPIQSVTTFAIMDAVGETKGPASDFIFGSTPAHAWRSTKKEQIALGVKSMAIQAQLGVKSMRFSVGEPHNWSPDPTQWDFSDSDALVDACLSHNMAVTLLFAYNGNERTKSPEVLERMVKDKAPKNMAFCYPSTPDLWRKRVQAIAERYRGKIQRYEIFNEPDLTQGMTGWYRGTPEELAEQQRIAYEEIKRIDPQAIVMTSGFGCPRHGRHRPEMVDMILTEGFFDEECWHMHGDFTWFIGGMRNHVLPRRERMGITKPFYFTETSRGGDHLTEFSAVDLVQTPIFAWSVGATGWHAFTGVVDLKGYETERLNDTKYGEGYYRIFNPDFTPRPSVVSYNTMARLLSGRRYAKTLDVGTGRHAILFQGAGTFSPADSKAAGAASYVLAAWKQDATISDLPYLLRVGSGAVVKRVDVMGNQTRVPVHQGLVAMTIEPRTAYLSIDGATGVDLVGPLITTGPAGLMAGGAGVLELQASHPLAKPLSLALAWEAGDGLEAAAQPPVSVASRLAQLIPVEVTAGEMFAGGTLRGEVSVSPAGWKLPLNIPVSQQRWIGTADQTERDADFVIDQPHQILSFTDHDPNSQHLVWRGPEDNSARIWLWVDEKNLHIHAEVRDDQPNHPYMPWSSGCWKGDSVQVGIARPGDAGWYEFGTGASEGTRSAFLWMSPSDRPAPKEDIVVTLVPMQSGWIYAFKVPLASIGMDHAQLTTAGLRFNLAINDQDEDGIRASAGAISAGILTNKDILTWPLMRMRQEK